MSRIARATALALAVFLGCATSAPAQRPTAEQARQVLQARPELVLRLRQQMLASGLTPDQIRARLRAEGYPSDLLDPYLPGATTRPDSATLDDAFSAVRALGLSEDDLLMGGDTLDPDPRGIRRRRATADDRDTLDALPARGRTPTRRDPRDRTGTGARGEARDDPLGDRRDDPRLRRGEDTLRVFGRELFAGGTTEFDPNLAGPVDANYRVGPGDRLVLVLTGDVEASYALDVTREGFVVIPQVGQLYIANLTLGQIESLLYSRLARVYSGVARDGSGTTQFSLSMSRLRSIQVFVTGEVTTPSSYRISSLGTALTALYAAGGPSLNGSMRRILVRRGGAIVDSLDLYDYLLRGDASRDVRLQNGDVVFVPVHGPQVRASGEFVRPAVYELRPGETLAALLQAAGGLRPTAAQQRVQIERIVPPAQRVPGGRDRIVIDVSASQLASGAAPAFRLEAGDVVRIFPIAERVRNRVTVLGNVWDPGAVGFSAGMRVSDALRQAGGVRPDVYLGRLHVTRLRADSSRVQLTASFADTTGRVVNDFPLQEDDEIRVYSVTTFRPERYIVVNGAVRDGGRIAWREGMTVRDAILIAGGLEESAYLREAEIARMPRDRSQGATARTIRVPLDSTYLFERRPDGAYAGPPGVSAPAAGAPETPLEPYDHVLVFVQPNWEAQRTVVLAGEVRFRGDYALQRKDERLRDVLERAGGLTEFAYPQGIVFFRHNGGVGRVGVDLPAVLRDPRHMDNILLEAGDSIAIPRFESVVYVRGAVNGVVNAPGGSPGVLVSVGGAATVAATNVSTGIPELRGARPTAPSTVAVPYVPGRDIDYYIAAAGGTSRLAERKRAFVQQPDGKFEARHRYPLVSNVRPRPGAIVTVPERDPAQQGNIVGIVTAVAQVVGSLVGIIAIVAR